MLRPSGYSVGYSWLNYFCPTLYDKESIVSYEIAKRYRKQINPMSRSLSEEDTETIKEEIGRRVRNELQIRVSKGYKGIDFELIGPVTENLLKELLIHAP